ncbi:SDR family NAD(P)-dependent oxidoreductase [Moorella sulfitireducens]|uniref:SDR family NAD(P)-dependent oxidoreductase n=1 Tax=Neomoorella sulfitireducens TaxID=2972948 RepID=UPI0021AD3566|nr:SDR family oxidoreductase [Moorella sulfitireducens]
MENLYTFDGMYQRLLGIDINGVELAPGMKIRGGKNAKPMKDILELNGKVAIVTGGAMGMGFCVVNRLCEAGANVVIADIAIEYANAAVEFFKSKNYNVKFIRTDVRYIPQIQAAVDFTVKEFGGVDILVNNAAIFSQVKFLDLTEETYDDTVDTDLKGTLFFTQAVVKQMVRQGRGGKIVNVASVAGFSAEPTYGCMIHYVAAKSGVVGITQSLAKELKPLGININCVAPGGMLTVGGMSIKRPPEIIELSKTHPSAPTTDPDDVARVVFMLCTEISNYMHGATVVVDGGARWGIQK